MKRFLAALFIMVMIPYVTTLGWTGRSGGSGEAGLFGENGGSYGTEAGGKVVVSERNGREISVPAEEFLVSVLAAQIPVTYGPETLKAQAVLARTYIYREMDGADRIYEEELDMDALSRAQMEKLWGDSFLENYGKIKAAVTETAGETVTFEGRFIEPLFCRASAGSTRGGDEDHPYLKQTESPGDQMADGFLSLAVFTPKTLAERINSIPDAVPVSPESLPEEIQIGERDGAGYVKKVQIGQKTYTGEEVQYALGLSSPHFSFEEFDGKIRVVCKGIGHGYGFSQAGASALEKEGNDYRQLLNYYFQNIEITES